jgi:hypothetical protein
MSRFTHRGFYRRNTESLVGDAVRATSDGARAGISIVTAATSSAHRLL